MKIMMIDGSPKVIESNSGYFMQRLKEYINDNEIIEYKLSKLTDYEKITSDALTSNVLVFAFPLYVDSIPSHLLRFLYYIEDNYKDKLHNTKVYVISNCGFYEGKQNNIALKIMKCWCKKMNLEWGQGIGVGAGEMMGGLEKVPIDKGPNKNLGLALKELANNIEENTSGEDIFTTPSSFPRIAFRVAANSFWINKASKNGLKKRELNRCIVKQ